MEGSGRRRCRQRMDLVIQVSFALIALLILASAGLVVTARNIIHAALWLIACFFGVGALYLLLEAEFLAVVQVLVYVGAVSVLMLFAIMLTPHITQPDTAQLTSRWWAAGLLAVALFGTAIAPVLLNHVWPVLPATALIGVADLGRAFVGPYVLHFQIVGVLLTVALIGAIVIAYEEQERRRRVLTLAEEFELRRRRAAAAEQAPSEPAVADE
jgi:NADH-quinone oxidoreductase subunit J